MNAGDNNYYELLGVSKGADENEIKNKKQEAFIRFHKKCAFGFEFLKNLMFLIRPRE